MTPEENARKQIDAMLKASGWEVQSKDAINLSAARGVAICELTFATGEPDYTLFVEGKAIGTVEAKPEGETLTSVEEQSAKYVAGVPRGLPAWKSPLPFCYESTGKETFFTNRLDPDPRSRQIFAFHRPETLLFWVQQEKQLAHPICCFGDPAEARIVTVGLNPSDGELTLARNWPDTQMDHAKLAERCHDYFTAPHNWFAPWSEGLRYLKVSYRDGTAVHIDLSPRATRPVSEFETAWEQELFLGMVERDLWVFFGTLELCRKAQLVLMAGSVTGKYYLNEFLQKFAPDYGYSLDGPFNRLEHPGRGKTAWHALSGGGRNLKVFFCSSSPSDPKGTLLPQRILEHADELK